MNTYSSMLCASLLRPMLAGLAASFLVSLFAAQAFGQAAVDFNNIGLSSPPDRLIRWYDPCELYFTNNTPVEELDPVVFATTNIGVQLYYGPLGTPEDMLTPVTNTPAHMKPPGTLSPGTWRFGGTRTFLPFPYGGGDILLQVRAWSCGGPDYCFSYEGAVGKGGGHTCSFFVTPYLATGKSSVFVYTLPSGPSAPSEDFQMRNFQGFSMHWCWATAPFFTSDDPRYPAPLLSITNGIGESAKLEGGFPFSTNIIVLGTDPTGSQWRRNGTNVTGWRVCLGSYVPYTIANVQPGDAGVYTLVATNAYGSNSASVSLTVVARLTTSVVGAGTIVRSPNQPNFDLNSTVMLTAVPASGWVFDHWSGDANGAVIPLNVVMTTNKNITANFVAGGTSCTNAPDGLVSWWAAENDASDAMGNNPGTLQNGLSFAAGKVGQAFNLDGVDDLVLLPGAPPIPTPWTVELWVSRQDSPDNSALLLADGSQSLKLEQYPNTRKVGFSKYPDDDYAFNYIAPVGDWTHLAFAASSTDTKLYVNGSLQDTIAASIPLPLGKFGSGTKGLVDELSVYNRALSETEIQNIYDAGSLGKCLQPACMSASSGLVGWWPAANNANDVIGNNNGTLQGGTTFAAGKTGMAFSFDGVDDFVEVPNSSALNPDSSFTIEAWVKTSGTADYSGLVNKFYDANNTGYLLGFNYGGTLRCDRGDGGGSYTTAFNPATITDGRWHHAVAVFAGSQTLYVDGVPGPTISWTPRGPVTWNGQPLYLGRYPGYANRSFSGLLDEVCIYDRELLASEIRAIYSAGSVGKCLTPVYITSFGRDGNNFNLSWLSQRGLTYRVQYKTDINPAAPWTDVAGDVTAAGNSASKTDVLPANAPARFYRVEMFR